MINDRLALLRDYPFRRLNGLLKDVEPPRDVEPLVMSIGEPQHPYPDFVTEQLTKHAGLWSKYPPTNGTSEFRTAVKDWITRRYSLPPGIIEPDRHVLPVAGTREALFAVALLAVPTKKHRMRPTVLIPDPFYQIYSGAAIMAGAEPVYVPTTEETGFLPDFLALPADQLERAALAYLCSPSNPQGAVASLNQLKAYVRLARDLDFILATDECYCEIYCGAPPPGIIEACATDDGHLRNVIAFHSLSKRSNVPGLRSGFVVGDSDLIMDFARLRQYTGGASPGPILAAATSLWKDEAHVKANRALYRDKFSDAEKIIGSHPHFYRPDGGFYLWLKVGDGEETARRLWASAGVKVMPGAYLSREGGNPPGAAYIRLALVHDRAITTEALTRLATHIQE